MSIALQPAWPDRVTRFDQELARPSALGVGISDILTALATSICGLAVIAGGLTGVLSLPIAIFLHIATLSLPLALLVRRLSDGGELTVPVLLLLTTIISGPIGATGCTFLALGLHLQRPSPVRLQHWYDYIAGVVTQDASTRIYDELVAGRLPSDPEASVPRLIPILNGSSIAEQQRVLGLLGRHYHGDFRPVLRRALRNRSGMIRAQAAAVASGLDLAEKSRLWANSEGVQHSIDAAATTSQDQPHGNPNGPV